jgi:hypothetical protein
MSCRAWIASKELSVGEVATVRGSLLPPILGRLSSVLKVLDPLFSQLHPVCFGENRLKCVELTFGWEWVS